MFLKVHFFDQTRKVIKMNKAIATVAILLTMCLCPGLSFSQGPEMSIDVSEYDFGKIQYGEKKTEEFNIKNTGDKPLQITKVRTSCGCTKAKVEDLFLLPNESTKLLVGFDTKGLSPGKTTKTVYIHSSDREREIYRIKVYAEVVRRISLTPDTLVAKLENFQEKVSLPMKVLNSSDQEITLKTSKIRGMIKNATLAPKLVVAPPGEAKDFKVNITLPEADKVKYYKGDILLETNYPSEKNIIVSSFISVGKP
jgi:hypothetical protein